MAKAVSDFEREQQANPGLSDQLVIRRLCERLLAEAEAEPPVPAERIASLRGIVAIEERELAYAGMLTPKGQNFVVWVRASDGYERQRFTVFHETGHTVFPGFERRQLRCASRKSRLEQRCDIAATELLLPYRFVHEDLRNADFGLVTVEELAVAYEASIEASALRFVDLWPEPTALLVFSERHKPSERGREHLHDPRLRLDYAYTSGIWPYLRRHKSVDDHSAIARAHAGELVDEVTELGDLATAPSLRVHIHARRYGHDGRVLALIRQIRRADS